MATRIGLVGAGSMGALHARAVAQSAEASLAWVADPDPVSGGQIAGKFGTTWTAEPDLDSVDAVIIAAPTQFHHDLALAAIDAGRPLLLEKPLADTYEHSRAIVDAARECGVALMCGLLERFNPAVRTVAEIVRSPVHVTTVRHSPYSERIHTGVASDLLIHDVDLVLRLFGTAPTAVTGHYGYFEPRSTPGSEDVADATLRFGAGEIATLSVSRIAQHKVRSLTIAELGRMIEVDLIRQDITIYRQGQESSFDEDAGYRQQTIIEIPIVRHPGEPLQLQLQHFIALIEGREDFGAELDTLLLPHRVIDQIAAAAGEVVDR